MQHSRPIVSIKGLNKFYGPKTQPKTIFTDFSLDIFANDRVGILGKNGVGKTTLANMIIGKTPYDGGQIIIDESVADKMRCFGYLPQTFAFPDFFSSRDVLKIIERDLKRNGLYEADSFSKVIEKLEIQELANRRYKKLSGGEKQKLNLASVLLYRPKVLILDEFTSNIDIQTSFYIRQMLEAIECTLIVISHNAKEISEICNRLIFLKSGKIFRELKGRENINENLILNAFADMNTTMHT